MLVETLTKPKPHPDKLIAYHLCPLLEWGVASFGLDRGGGVTARRAHPVGEARGACGFRAWDFGLRVWGLGFRVQSLGFRMECLGFRVQGNFPHQPSGTLTTGRALGARVRLPVPGSIGLRI